MLERGGRRGQLGREAFFPDKETALGALLEEAGNRPPHNDDRRVTALAASG